MEKNPLLVPNEYELQKLIDELSKVLSKDNNINVTAAAATLLSKVALGAPNVFKPFASSTIAICLTRSKEVKPLVKNSCSECLDSVYATTVGRALKNEKFKFLDIC
jgi:hypothetical protein